MWSKDDIEEDLPSCICIRCQAIQTGPKAKPGKRCVGYKVSGVHHCDGILRRLRRRDMSLRREKNR